MGFGNIKIYNGGLKDWAKAGNKTVSADALPEYDGKFMNADELLKEIQVAEKANCLGADGSVLLTLLDLRTEHFLPTEHPIPDIHTTCPTIHYLLDDLIQPEARANIPQSGRVVSISETGNRDIFAMRYLYKFGYTNIVGLEFGMRGWIKLNHPIETQDSKSSIR
ncbi:MAG: rhodanese-like domain-containing protein [Pseudomonadota bacterium]